MKMVIVMNIESKKNNLIPLEIAHLEKENQVTSNDVFYFLENKTIKHFNPNCFLYHGIRFDDKLTKLENTHWGSSRMSRGILFRFITNHAFERSCVRPLSSYPK